MPENFVTFSHQIPGEIKQLRRRNARRARQPMPLAMRHEHEIAPLHLAVFSSLDLQPAPARRDEMEHQKALRRWNLKSPRRAELGAGVEDAVHPQEVKRFAERVHGKPGIFEFHRDQHASPSRIFPVRMDE